MNTSATEIPGEIGHLATLLHQQGSQLAIDYPGNLMEEDSQRHDLWHPENNQIVFTSTAARNHCVAVHAYRGLVQGSSDPATAELFDLALSLWRSEIREGDKASGRLLALAGERVDVLSMAAELITNGERRVFDVLHCVEAALPYLEALTVDGLCAITSAQYPKTKGDLASGILFNAIEDAVVPRPQLAWALYRHLRDGMTDATANLYGSALLACVKAGEVDEVLSAVLRDIASSQPLLARMAAWAISRMLREHDLLTPAKEGCLHALRQAILSLDAQIRQGAIHAAAHAAAKHGELIDDLLPLARREDGHALHALANYLFINSDVLKGQQRLPELLQVVPLISPDMTATASLNDVDWVLSRLVNERPDDRLVEDALSAWIIRHGNAGIRDKASIEQFEQTIIALAESPARLSSLITDWFASTEGRLAAACGGLISFLWVHGVRQPTFAREVLDRLDAADLMLLARRMLGYVFFEEALLSLTFSFLDTNDAPSRTYGLLYALLTKEVGRDFPSDTLKAIEHRRNSADAALAPMLDSAHAKLTAYLSAMEKLPKLQELRAPLQLRRALALKRAGEMRKTMDQAEDRSVLRQFAKQVPLKAGIGWFSVENGNVGETHQLHSISHEVKLPWRSLLDPVGYEIAGMGYRLATKGD